MKPAAVFLACALTAATAAAQSESLHISSTTSPPPPPDYSRAALLRITSTMVEPPPPQEKRVEFGLGYIVIKAMNIRFLFSPFLAPLPGSVRRTNATIPDAFTMLGTEIPQTPRTWRSQRELNKEMRRIERTERERAKIKAEPE